LWRALSYFMSPSATTCIHTLSLPDALPIWLIHEVFARRVETQRKRRRPVGDEIDPQDLRREQRQGDTAAVLRQQAEKIGEQHARSEEHTSELQSRENLVCRLLLEEKNRQII